MGKSKGFVGFLHCPRRTEIHSAAHRYTPGVPRPFLFSSSLCQKSLGVDVSRLVQPTAAAKS
jgi:hypothetical protein